MNGKPQLDYKVSVSIHSLRCMGCGVCVSTCPAGIRTLVKKNVR